MAGLIAYEMQQFVGNDGKVLARLSLDILGVVAVGEFELTVDVRRPGRTIALVEAQVAQVGRTVVAARAWRLAPFETAEVAGAADDRIPGPDGIPLWDMTSIWPGGYIDSLEVRRSNAAEPGRAVSWIRTPVGLLAGESVGDIASWLALVDTTNGVAVRTSPKEWLFPNVDLTIHLHRQPVGAWVGLDTSVAFGRTGLGVTSTVLHDIEGPVGRAEQALTVRRAP